ncbi:MAG: family 20 glycosylhydrolase [Dysgonamonadaceae bacterium]|nr:family 20 glycosylhydrolase [Dysgonamonadaceae bacterium]
MKTLQQIAFILIALLCTQSIFCQKNEYNVIPKPVSLKPASGQFTFNEQTRLFIDKGLGKEVAGAFFVLSDRLNTAAGINLQTTTDSPKSNVIICKLNDKLPNKESYILYIAGDKITIEAREPAGFFYAAQTIRQLLPTVIESETRQNNVKWAVPCCKIEDSPYYRYRGMHLDVCRHFSPKEEVMAYLDQLAFLKINKFHWHLTDDQGWRIEIKKYPRLTEVGGFRNRTMIGHYSDVPRRWDDTRVGGYYTQEDIKEVLAYAKKRFITVIPEIEMPGHAIAALAGYPQYSCSGGPFEVEGRWGIFNDIFCAREETFGFLQDILDEVAELFPGEYVHIGGDEAPKIRWERCYACQTRMKEEGLKDEHELQSYFVKRMGKHLTDKGKRFIGWDEILEGGLAPNAIVMSWRGNEGGIAAARQGHDVIMTPTYALYLDYYQSQLPSEPLAIGGYVSLQMVYEYNPTPKELTPEEAKHILGPQANLWTEYLPSRERREYMIFPRIVALAENGWLPQDKKDFRNFESRLPFLLERYDIMGINYSRAFFNVSGNVFVENGKLKLSLHTADPRTDIHYTTDGTKASPESPVYTTPISLGDRVMIVNAIPVKNGVVLSAPYNQQFISNKAAGQKVTVTPQPSEKYKGKGGLTLTDCILGRYPILGSQWLGFDKEDAEVIIEFVKPESVSKITVSSTHQPGQWIYAPQSVECFISEDGSTYKSIGILQHDAILKANSKAVIDMAPVTIKKIKADVRNFGVIPLGEQGGGHKAWLFLDEIIAE